MKKPCYSLLALVLVLLLSCQAEKKIPNTSAIHEPPPTPSSSPLQAQNIKALVKKQLPDSALENKHDELSSQFSLSGKLHWATGEKVRLHLTSRLTGNAQIFIYRALTPLIMLNEWQNLQQTTVSPATLTALATSLEQATDLQHPWQDRQPHTAIGEYRFVKHFSHPFSGKEGSWQSHCLPLPSLAQGIYLVEMRLGPQASYFPVVISQLRAIAKRDTSGEHLWFVSLTGQGQRVEPKVFFEQQGNWQKLPLQKSWQTSLPESWSGRWVVASQGRDWVIVPRTRFASLPQAEKVWIARESYFPGDLVEVGWLPRADKPAQWQLFSPQGTLLWRKNLPPEQREYSFYLPTQGKGRYLLEMTSPWQQSFSLLVGANQREVPTKHLEFPFRYLPLGEVIEVTAYDADSDQIQVRLKRGEEVVEQQERIASQGQARFFFELPKPGEYTLECLGKEQTFKVTSQSPGHLEISHNYFAKPPEKLSCFFPAQRSLQVLLWQSQQKIQTLIAQPQQKQASFSVANHTRFGSLERYFVKQSNLHHQIWQIPYQHSSRLRVTLPSAVEVQQPTPTQIAWQPPAQGELLVWAVSGDQRKSNRFQESSLTTTQVQSQAQGMAKLYHQWLSTTVFKKYTQAHQAYQKQQFSQARHLCQEILLLASDHKPTQQLLMKILSHTSESKLPSILQRMQHHTLSQPLPSLPVHEFFQILAEKSAVYIELAPAINASQTTPAFEVGKNLLEIFHEVLELFSLDYQIEIGTVVVFPQQAKRNLSWLQQIDHKRNGQFLSPHNIREQKSPLVLWQGWFPKQNQITVNWQFPHPGVWTICVVGVAKGKLCITRQLVWVEKRKE